MENDSSILIFGATRGTGLEAARALVAAGARVNAAVRPSSNTAELAAAGVDTLIADVFDTESVGAALEATGADAVIISLSGAKGSQQRPDREGAITIIDTAKRHGIRRVLMVTAIGCGDSKPAVAPKVLEILGKVLAAKTVAEQYLEAAGLEMTILRPGGLTDDPASGTAMITSDHSAMGVANRADVGRLLADCVNDPATIGGIYHVVDPEITWQAPLQRGDDVGDKR